MPTEEFKTEIEDSLTIRHQDVVITISASPNGVLDGRTNEEMLKYSADILLQETQNGSLENILDTNIALQETLKEDYDWKGLEILEFMKKWRRRLYLRQIGDISKSKEFQSVRATVEPSSDAELLEESEKGKEDPKKPKVVVDNSNHVTIGIPKIPIESKEEEKERKSFNLIDKDNAVVIKKRGRPSEVNVESKPDKDGQNE